MLWLYCGDTAPPAIIRAMRCRPHPYLPGRMEWVEERWDNLLAIPAVLWGCAVCFAQMGYDILVSNMKSRVSRRVKRWLWEAAGFVALAAIGVLVVQWLLHLLNATVRS